MSHLYEINAEIERLTEAAIWDDERGEWIDQGTGEIFTDEQLEAEFTRLGMERHEILVWIAKKVMNIRGEIEAHKAEEKRLADRRKALERVEERLTAIIDRECHGEKTDLEIATFSYRKSSAVEITDNKAAVDWLLTYHADALTVKEPAVNKTEVKRIIKAGEAVPGCEIVERMNGSLK